MDWLKEIIKNTEIKDNKLDIETLMISINEEFSKHAIPIIEHNNIKNQLNIANENNETLKNTIENQRDIMKRSAAKFVLAKNNADEKYEDFLISRFDMSNVEIKEDGSIDESSLLEQVKPIKSEHKKLFNSSKYTPLDTSSNNLSSDGSDSFINIINSNKIRK